MIRSQKQKPLSLFIGLVYLILFVSVIFSFRAISSIGIGVLIVAGVVKNWTENKTLLNPHVKNLFLAGCILFYVIQLISLFYNTDIQQGWNQARIKSGLVFIPLAVCCTSYIGAYTRPKLLSWYCLLLSIASLYCLTISAIKYSSVADSSVFFYHSLVRPLSQHAVFFSILVFIGLLFLLESILRKTFVFNRSIHYSMVIFLSAFLFLLSSKLVIIFYLFYAIIYFIRLIRQSADNKRITSALFILFIIIGGLVLLLRNPVSERFMDITHIDTRLITEEKNSPGDYFNGLQFRLLQWKLVPEILSENKKWLTGVTPGDAQYYLDQKYIQRNMYTGKAGSGDKGYLGYHTHNQFLESLLQSGWPGLIIFIGICLSLIQMARKSKTAESVYTIILLLVLCFTDAVFETQYGLFIFTFFPLFLSEEERQ